jgi:hypothetical protein
MMIIYIYKNYDYLFDQIQLRKCEIIHEIVMITYLLLPIEKSFYNYKKPLLSVISQN